MKDFTCDGFLNPKNNLRDSVIQASIETYRETRKRLMQAQLNRQTMKEPLVYKSVRDFDTVLPIPKERNKPYTGKINPPEMPRKTIEVTNPKHVEYWAGFWAWRNGK